jgi:hypothetical protein
MRHVCLPTCFSISEGHTCRLFRISYGNCDRQHVGCSDVATEYGTDGRTDCPCPEMCAAYNLQPKMILSRLCLFCISLCTFATDMA